MIKVTIQGDSKAPIIAAVQMVLFLLGKEKIKVTWKGKGRDKTIVLTAE